MHVDYYYYHYYQVVRIVDPVPDKVADRVHRLFVKGVQLAAADLSPPGHCVDRHVQCEIDGCRRSNQLELRGGTCDG